MRQETNVYGAVLTCTYRSISAPQSCLAVHLIDRQMVVSVAGMDVVHMRRLNAGGRTESTAR